MKFKSFKMHDDEDITKLFLRAYEVVNMTRVLDEKLGKHVVVQQVFECPPERLNTKVLSI